MAELVFENIKPATQKELDTATSFDVLVDSIPAAKPNFTAIENPQSMTEFIEDTKTRDFANEIYDATSDPFQSKSDVVTASYWSNKLDLRFDNAWELRYSIARALFNKDDISASEMLKGIRELEIEEYRAPAFEARDEPGLLSRMWSSIKESVVTPRDIESQISRGPFMSLLLGREEFPELDQLHRKGFKKAVVDAYEVSGTRMVKSLGGRTQSIGEIGDRLATILGADVPASRKLNKDLAEWGEMMAMAADQWYIENPDSQIDVQPGTGFIGTTAQYVLHPENILQGSLETVPMLLSALLGHITFSGIATKLGFGQKFLPWVGRVAGIAEPELGEEYFNARQQGREPGAALAQAYTKAYTRAIIEEWTLGEKIKIFKGTAGRAASKGFSKATTDLLLGGGKAYVRGAAEEGTQSVTDRFWEMVFSDSEEWYDGGFKGLFSRLTEGASEAAAVGGLLEMGMSGTFAVSGSAVRRAGQVSTTKKVQRVNQIRKDIDKNKAISDLEKSEINKILDDKIQEIFSGIPVEEKVSDEVIEELISPEDVTATEETPLELSESQIAEQLGTTLQQIRFNEELQDRLNKNNIIITEQIVSEFKPVPKKGPGLTAAERALLLPEQQRKARFAQLQAEKVGFKQGVKESREQARRVISKLKEARKLTKGVQQQALALAKEFIDDAKLRADFLARIPRVENIEQLKLFTEKLEQGIARAEQKSVVKELKSVIKTIKPKQMLPQFSGPAQTLLDSIQVTKPTAETIIKRDQLIDFADQVLDTSHPDSVAVVQAEHLKILLSKQKAKTVNIQDLSTESLEQIIDTFVSLKFQNDFISLETGTKKAEQINKRIEQSVDEIEANPKPIKSSNPIVAIGQSIVELIASRHSNLESLNDYVNGGISGTYKEWVKAKNKLTAFVYDILNNGTDEQYKYSFEIEEAFQTIMAKHGVDIETVQQWMKKQHAFAKGTIVLSESEMLSVFMHSRNSHNLQVLIANGMDRIKGRKKTKLRGFTQTVIDDIVRTLSEEQKSFAKEVGVVLMDNMNRVAINETSVELENREIARTDNYWSAARSIRRKVLGKLPVGVQSLIEGMGVLKERVGTGNPLLLSGFFETVYITNKNVAAYKGMAAPLRDAKAILNSDRFAEAAENNGYETELKIMKEQVSRIEDNSAEIGGVGRDIESIVSTLIRGFAKSRFALNAKIAPRQQLSSALISAYVNPKFLLEFKGVATKAIKEEMESISPQIKMRMETNRFDRDIGDSDIQNELLRYLTGKHNASDIFLMGMKFHDINAIADIFRAVKAEVKENNPTLDIASKEFKSKLKERFEWVFRHTQPTWHTKDRSILGSSRNVLVRAATMFMSQREKLVMMVTNANRRFANSEKTFKDIKEVARVWGTVGSNLAMFTMYNLAWAVAIQRKEKTLRDLAAMFGSDVLGLLFFGKYATEIIRVSNSVAQGKFAKVSVSTGPENTIKQLITGTAFYVIAAEHFITGEKYKSGPNRLEEKWKTEIWVASEAMYDGVAGVMGLPFTGPKDIINSLQSWDVLPGGRKKKKQAKRAEAFK
ncbi:MAG: hypothetical protein KAS32_10815 [Candidatus Peribacteraceae bacterium]|nr:hypothetical protein [Candidatus Peribacteraceae bacterium]